MAIKPKNKSGDPLDINARLYRQIGRLLDDLEAQDAAENITMPQRISALIAIGRIQKMFVDLKKGEFSLAGGSAIDKYAAAFGAAPNAARGGASGFAGGGGADVGELDREPDEDRDFDA